MTARPYRLDFELPLTEMNTAATRANRFVQAKRAARTRLDVVQAVRRHRPKAPLTKAKIRCERHSSVEPDFENLALGFKGIIDALTLSGPSRGRSPKWLARADILADDSPDILEREYAWVRAPRGQGKLRIILEEVTS